MKIDWKKKLTSRKFLIMVGFFVASVCVIFGMTENQTAQIMAVVLNGLVVIAYIIGEAKVDAATAGSTERGGWLSKLTSRKFLSAVASFVVSILVVVGMPENEIAQIAAIIMSGGTIFVYILSESSVDAAAGSETGEEDNGGSILDGEGLPDIQDIINAATGAMPIPYVQAVKEESQR